MPFRVAFEEKYLSSHSKIHKGKQTSFLAKVNSRCFFLFPAAMFVSLREGHQHGVSILSSINLCETFWQITRVRNTTQIWHLDRLLIYLSSITCQFLDFIHGMVSIFFSRTRQLRDSENQQYKLPVKSHQILIIILLPATSKNISKDKWLIFKTCISFLCRFIELKRNNNVFTYRTGNRGSIKFIRNTKTAL